MKKSLKSGLCVLLGCITAVSLFACGGDGDDKPTLLDRAQELSQEVDKILSTEELLKEKETTLTKGIAEDEIAFTSVTDGWTDVSNPDENGRYQEYLESGRYTMDTTKTHLTNADTFVEEVKNVKNSVLNYVVQLNTWVGDSYTEGGWRLGYDKLNDVVTIETLARSDNYLYGETFDYYNIKAAQTEDGKALIEASYIATHSGALNYRSSVRFFEDELWLYTTEIMNQQTHKLMRILVYADLVNGTIASVSQSDRETALIKRGDETGYIVKPHYSNDIRLYADNAQGERVANASYYPDGVSYAYIDIYELTGWDALYTDGTNYELLLENGEVLSPQRKEFTVLDTPVEAATYERDCPYLAIYFSPTQEKSFSDYVLGSLAAFGLSFKDESVADVFKGYDDLDSFRRSVKVFDKDGTFEPTEEEFADLFERIDIKSPSIDEMRSMLSEPKISHAEQVEDEAYYEIYNTDFSGTVSLNQDTGVLNLSEIAVTSGQSVVLNKGKYNLCIALCDEFSSVLVSSQQADYTGGTLSITGAPEYDVNNAPLGAYTLKAYLAKESGARISKMVTLSAADGEYLKENAESVLTVKAGVEGLTVLHEAVQEE
ncbi:MAG: hypothetical protein IJY38_01600, partial [Clostridia bacterium]|nr:hypothetical protein [Clostridia bacterium]